jgi:hypothetical protein
VELASAYLLAIQAGSEHAVGTLIDRTKAAPAPTVLLLALAEDIILSVTDLAADANPCADSFTLDEVGCVLLSALHDWARDSPTTAAPGLTAAPGVDRLHKEQES